MHPRLIYLINVLAMAVIAVLWLNGTIGTVLFAALMLAEASLTIWLGVLYMRREREQVNAFRDLFASVVEQRAADLRADQTGSDQP